MYDRLSPFCQFCIAKQKRYNKRQIDRTMIKTKIRQYFFFRRSLSLAALGLLVMASLSHPLAAQTLTQGYNSDTPLQRGMIVQLKKDDPSKIEPATSDTMERIHGVVVAANDALVTLSADGQKTFVATGGRFEVLVSNQNGPVSAGDYITISALPGIGMRADGN